jgi:hypothetical protein
MMMYKKLTTMIRLISNAQDAVSCTIQARPRLTSAIHGLYLLLAIALIRTSCYCIGGLIYAVDILKAGCLT